MLTESIAIARQTFVPIGKEGLKISTAKSVDELGLPKPFRQFEAAIKANWN